MFEFDIEGDSKVPKYKQVIRYISSQIENEEYRIGERIPSINETSEELYLSRDTVEKAYNELRRRGIISSVRGKGFYVANTNTQVNTRVLMLLNKLSAYKKIIYEAFVETLGNSATVDLKIFNYDSDQFEAIILNNLAEYDFYVVMPIFQGYDEKTLQTLEKIPREQLILIGKDLEEIDGNYGAVYEEFETDAYHALSTGASSLSKYTQCKLVIPSDHVFLEHIARGVRKFCVESEIQFHIHYGYTNEEINEGDLFIIIDESDMVQVIKQINRTPYKLGKEIGLISYNETPVKEILCDGISTLSTDFHLMGVTAAQFVLSREMKKTPNPFSLLIRSST